jgi:hypothetical protein
MTKYLTWTELAALPADTRVEFPEGHDIYPHCIVPAGTTGTIVSNDLNEIFAMLSVRVENFDVQQALKEWNGNVEFAPKNDGVWDQPSPLALRSVDADVALLAKHFVDVIHEWTTAAELAEIKKRNATYDAGVCATHDFMDANMAMQEAFVRTFSREPFTPIDVEEGTTSEERVEHDLTHWNRAWDIAKREHLGGGA